MSHSFQQFIQSISIGSLLAGLGVFLWGLARFIEVYRPRNDDRRD